MRPLTYFAFTLLSVVIQFCVMDFIQEKIEPNNEPIYGNSTVDEKRNSIGILKNYANEGQALFYRLKKSKAPTDKGSLINEKYLNTSILKQDDSVSTTELTFTIYDLIYDDDNNSILYGSTTETDFTSTELDNSTEIALFEKTSTTSTPKYKQCDVRCCCDDDCTEMEINLFGQCMANTSNKKRHVENDFTCDGGAYEGYKSLFCIVKTNLPERRIIKKQMVDEAEIKNAFVWSDNSIKVASPKFKRNLYSIDDPVWILSKSLQYLDVPARLANNYCSIRRPMKFLANEKIKCQVKFKELEMFRILNMSLQHAQVISVTNHSLNNTVMDCSSLHCTNWTIIYCDDNICVSYNKSLHETTCRDSWCYNVAQKLEYTFQVYDTKVVSAIVKLHVRRISSSIQYIWQEIDVHFLMGNGSINGAVKLSGNPGYLIGFPVIVSYADYNRTELFFNNSGRNDLTLPINNGGVCFKSINTKKVLEFGYNRRMKCKVSFRPRSMANGTEACNDLQKYINELTSIARTTYISPYGNPESVNDDDWLVLDLEKDFIYGEFHSKNTELHCFNLQTRFAFVFTYADLGDREEENKLLSVRLSGFSENVTLSAKEVSVVITVDVNFINVNKVARYDIAAPPHFNLHLPKNFFVPSHTSRMYKGHLLLNVCLCIVIVVTK